MRMRDQDAIHRAGQIQRFRQEAARVRGRIERPTDIEENTVASAFGNLDAIPANLMGRAVYREANVHASVHWDNL